MFKGEPDFIKSVAVDANGTAWFYQVKSDKLFTNNNKFEEGSKYAVYLAGSNFDTSDWKNSALDREVCTDEWISLDDELPKIPSDYLTFNGYDQDVQEWNENGWLNMYDAVLITHWMPLPENPIKCSEDK